MFCCLWMTPQVILKLLSMVTSECFVPPNCISWKQACDQGIIEALKKRAKYFILKDVLEFIELDNAQKGYK